MRAGDGCGMGTDVGWDRMWGGDGCGVGTDVGWGKGGQSGVERSGAERDRGVRRGSSKGGRWGRICISYMYLVYVSPLHPHLMASN